MPAFFASTDIFRPPKLGMRRNDGRFVDFKVTPPNGALPPSLISVGGVTSLLELELRRPVGLSVTPKGIAEAGRVIQRLLPVRTHTAHQPKGEERGRRKLGYKRSSTYGYSTVLSTVQYSSVCL